MTKLKFNGATHGTAADRARTAGLLKVGKLYTVVVSLGLIVYLKGFKQPFYRGDFEEVKSAPKRVKACDDIKDIENRIKELRPTPSTSELQPTPAEVWNQLTRLARKIQITYSGQLDVTMIPDRIYVTPRGMTYGRLGRRARLEVGLDIGRIFIRLRPPNMTHIWTPDQIGPCIDMFKQYVAELLV